MNVLHHFKFGSSGADALMRQNGIDEAHRFGAPTRSRAVSGTWQDRHRLRGTNAAGRLWRRDN
jgi:hypothetical protein